MSGRCRRRGRRSRARCGVPRRAAGDAPRPDGAAAEQQDRPGMPRVPAGSSAPPAPPQRCRRRGASAGRGFAAPAGGGRAAGPCVLPCWGGPCAATPPLLPLRAQWRLPAPAVAPGGVGAGAGLARAPPAAAAACRVSTAGPGSAGPSRAGPEPPRVSPCPGRGDPWALRAGAGPRLRSGAARGKPRPRLGPAPLRALPLWRPGLARRARREEARP